MELNRNHYFLVGTVLLLLGIQFRFLDSAVLTKETTHFINKRLDNKVEAPPASPFPMLVALPAQKPQRTVRPPRWLGWSMISIGAVLILHSLAMKKPD